MKTKQKMILDVDGGARPTTDWTQKEFGRWSGFHLLFSILLRDVGERSVESMFQSRACTSLMVSCARNPDVPCVAEVHATFCFPWE